MRKLILGLFVAFLIVNPAPVVPPDGVSFDPNDMPSPVMGVYEVYVNESISGQIDVVEPEGETVTVASEGGLILIPDSQVALESPAIKYIYNWSYTPSVVGVYAFNVKVRDLSGNEDNRTIVFGVLKKNQPPVITGCRRGIEIE